jgi:hypothetical protein
MYQSSRGAQRSSLRGALLACGVSCFVPSPQLSCLLCASLCALSCTRPCPLHSLALPLVFAPPPLLQFQPCPCYSHCLHYRNLPACSRSTLLCVLFTSQLVAPVRGADAEVRLECDSPLCCRGRAISLSQFTITPLPYALAPLFPYS